MICAVHPVLKTPRKKTNDDGDKKSIAAVALVESIIELIVEVAEVVIESNHLDRQIDR
jgi:hypothetical protein